MKPIKRKISSLLEDTLISLLGRRDDLTPPQRTLFVGGYADFKGVGEEFLRYFVELGGLKPHERVLDVGCGIGRMAVPLTTYLDKNGSYEGFDIVADGIHWCRKKITPKYPHFRFHLADVFNEKYNPHGRYRASEYHFPYERESFDFVFLTSVFTHIPYGAPRRGELPPGDCSRAEKGWKMLNHLLLTDQGIIGAYQCRQKHLRF